VARGPTPPMPETKEYWPDPKRSGGSGDPDDPFAYLTALRQAPPDTKDWG
jgi:hypothetical protein